MKDLKDIPHIRIIARQWVEKKNIINHYQGTQLPDEIQIIEEIESVLRGISFTLLTILGTSTMGRSRGWLAEELEKMGNGS